MTISNMGKAEQADRIATGQPRCIGKNNVIEYKVLT
ncbi:hypothetical protein BH10PLA2_BH10PLA2_00370 [soil metagenome]